MKIIERERERERERGRWREGGNVSTCVVDEWRDTSDHNTWDETGRDGTVKGKGKGKVVVREGRQGFCSTCETPDGLVCKCSRRKVFVVL